LQELLTPLFYGFAMVLAMAWLLLTVGSLLVAMGALLWFLLHQKPVPSQLPFGQKTVKSYDELGALLIDPRLLRTRKIFVRSISIFAGSLILGGAFALLLKLSNG
jgi:hypothetical protein